jgi:transglutaminase-like putative cysteine protease
MKRTANSLILSCLAATFVCAARAPAAETEKRAVGEKPRTRVFRMDYGATLDSIPAGAHVRVWLPVPQSNDHQKVKPLPAPLPAKGKTAIEPKYGNKILYFETKAPSSGSLSFETPYLVERREVLGRLGKTDGQTRLTDRERRLFLAANAKVPLAGKPLILLADVALPTDELAMARVLYDRVDEHVRYDKSQPGYGRGDVLWVCDSRFGNCTDFHSLFISLARSQDLPARFEIGFPLPPERGAGSIGGYHCWALFYTNQQGWVPVDISEADKHPEMKEYYFGSLTEDRVTFSTGRDIDLVPRQAGPPLNFFIYPHVEVDGKPLAKNQMQPAFAYRDVRRKKKE